MAWRNQGITGSNNIPLGTKNRLGVDGSGDGSGDATATDVAYDEPLNGDSLKRGRSPTQQENPDGPRARKKRNRWGDVKDNKAAGLMNLPTSIPTTMTPEQQDAYILHVRIEEISQKLRINDVVPADGQRSPSPAPQYDNFGRRVNTREYRYKKKLEDERHKLIEKALKSIPDYHPPADYRRPNKTQEKVYVPVNDYPEINFIGLLIGPRGNTLKTMEKESGAKIAIRGKGSVKEGKGKSDAAHASNQEEDLHCLIMADTEDKIEKAKKAINRVIETAASVPEGQNDLKKGQLRELAALNGTLRDDENQACQNCGEIGHRKYDCPHQRNYTAGLICRVCGNAGHIGRDCPERVRGSGWRNDAAPERARIGAGRDSDFDQFLNEIDAGGSGGPQARIEAGPGGGDNNRGGPKPWERAPAGGAAPWQQSSGGASSGAAPWAARSNDNYNSGSNYRTGNNNNAGGAAPWQQNQYSNGRGYGQQNNYGANQGYGGGRDNYGQQSYGGQSTGSAPWQGQSTQQPGGYDNYAAPPPPPSGDAPPPPPPM